MILKTLKIIRILEATKMNQFKLEMLQMKQFQTLSKIEIHRTFLQCLLKSNFFQTPRWKLTTKQRNIKCRLKCLWPKRIFRNGSRDVNAILIHIRRLPHELVSRECFEGFQKIGEKNSLQWTRVKKRWETLERH